MISALAVTLALAVSTPASAGVTFFVYDLTSKPSSITSPNGAAWALTHDDLSNELIEASPDRGVVASIFYAAGNMVTRTDARGITATHAYDTLNRLTGVTYPAAGEGVAYTWDACANGKGLLRGVADACTRLRERHLVYVAHMPGRTSRQVSSPNSCSRPFSSRHNFSIAKLDAMSWSHFARQ